MQATRDVPTRDWLRAIEAEWSLLGEEQGWSHPLELDTLYVGGGTPSLLAGGAMRELASIVARHAHSAPTLEWTAEANPESFTAEVAHDWRAAGVNRISLGAQSFDEGVLRWMGRLHGAGGPERAVEIARRAGFQNVSIDLIFGVPERLGRSWAADLERALSLAPEHVSLYGLTAESATPLGRWVAEGRERLADEDRYAEEYLLAHRILTGAGYDHYEVSNFGRPGFASRHNHAYWTGAAYAALGPGAHAFYPPVRRWNLRDWEAYQEALRARRLPIDSEERITPDDAALERVWLGLRTHRGAPLHEANQAQLDLARLWCERGWASINGDRLRLGVEGWLLLDRLAVDYAAAAEYAEARGSARLPGAAGPAN
jgi:oxygen-independent coproporphyrinogen III oxidase